MKKILSLTVLILSMLMFWSCQNDEDFNEPVESSVIAENDIAIIKALGFDESTIEDRGDYYVVEGDIVLEKKYLSEYGSQNGSEITTKQAVSTNGIVDQTKVRNITVGFDSSILNENTSVAADWRTATLEALEEWSKIPGCAVKFVYTTSNSPNIRVKYEDLGSRNDKGSIVLAKCKLARGGNPGDLLTINSNSAVNLDLDEKIGVIIHELGHALGLHHTDWRENGDNNAVDIPGTGEDYGSIMNSSITIFTRFSRNDIMAILILYPDNSKNKITASVSAVCPDTNVSYSLSNLTLSSYSTVRWEGVKNASLVSGQGTLSPIFKLSGNGEAKVKAVIDYRGHLIDVENSEVWIGAPGGEIVGDQSIYQPNGIYYFQANTRGNIKSSRWEGRGVTFLWDVNNTNTIRVKIAPVDPYKGGSFGLNYIMEGECGSTRIGFGGRIAPVDPSGPPPEEKEF